MVTDHTNLVQRRRAGDAAGPAGNDAAGAAEPAEPAPPAEADARVRAASGHCVDGRPCDHPDHGPADGDGGVIHYIV